MQSQVFDKSMEEFDECQEEFKNIIWLEFSDHVHLRLRNNLRCLYPGDNLTANLIAVSQRCFKGFLKLLMFGKVNLVPF